MSTTLPPTETNRLHALAKFALLDTAPEPEFERITAHAARIFHVPIALVSLVDAHRQWFKSHHGTTLCETPRDQAFCAHTILENRPLIVPDATLDARFADNPLVTGAPFIRFYAGAPLTTREGANLGSLCLLDTAPRAFSEADTASLVELAGVVMAAVEARLTEQRLRSEIAVHEQTAQALRVVEARYHRIAENTPGLVLQFARRADGRGEFLFVSDASRDILGVEPADLMKDANEYFKLVHPKDDPARVRAVAESVATLGPLRWEGRHRLANGQLKWLQISAQPERTADGDILWDGMMLDITERKRAENRLRMLESSIDNANDAILITEAEPTDLPGPRIRYVNRAFTRMSGYTEEEVIGQTPRMFQGPKTDPETTRKIREALKAWQPVRVELINYRKDGSEFWVELNIVPVANERGWWTHWVSVQREMSERKAAEFALEAARDEAQRANAAKNDFLSRMSHELRTPLNAILGFGQLLELSGPTPKQKESISHVLRGGRHLLGLINEVLDIARIESGKLELESKSVHVGTALEEASALVRPLAAARDIVLNIHPAEQSLDGIEVQADPQRLKQVLLNLLSNAIKYNHPFGRVDITCEPAADRRLRLSVRDTGPGISAKDLPRLFVPFERLDAGNTDVEGTGIGLAISRRLAEAMGGTLAVQSTVGRGSVFSLELPIAAGAVQDHGPRDVQLAVPILPLPAGPTTRTVLHIEDNPSNLTLVEGILSMRPEIQLLSTMQGRRGLEMARECAPELILLDVHLPDLAGDALLRALKEDESTRDIPVVMVSADATPVQVQRLLGYGAEAYLTKPLEIATFLRTVDEALAAHR